jgi:hypothetical protein
MASRRRRLRAESKTHSSNSGAPLPPKAVPLPDDGPEKLTVVGVTGSRGCGAPPEGSPDPAALGGPGLSGTPSGAWSACPPKNHADSPVPAEWKASVADPKRG